MSIFEIISDYLNKDNKLIRNYLVELNNKNLLFGIFCYEIPMGSGRMVVIYDDKKNIGVLFKSNSDEVVCYQSGVSLKVSQSLGNQLYQRLYKLHIRESIIYKDISKILNIDETLLKERLEEFDCIKDNTLDLISLNSLYDYYDKNFNFESINKLTTFV